MAAWICYIGTRERQIVLLFRALYGSPLFGVDVGVWAEVGIERDGYSVYVALYDSYGVNGCCRQKHCKCTLDMAYAGLDCYSMRGACRGWGYTSTDTVSMGLLCGLRDHDSSGLVFFVAEVFGKDRDYVKRFVAAHHGMSYGQNS